MLLGFAGTAESTWLQNKNHISGEENAMLMRHVTSGPFSGLSRALALCWRTHRCSEWSGVCSDRLVSGGRRGSGCVLGEGTQCSLSERRTEEAGRVLVIKASFGKFTISFSEKWSSKGIKAYR